MGCTTSNPVKEHTNTQEPNGATPQVPNTAAPINQHPTSVAQTPPSENSVILVSEQVIRATFTNPQRHNLAVLEPMVEVAVKGGAKAQEVRE